MLVAGTTFRELEFRVCSFIFIFLGTKNCILNFQLHFLSSIGSGNILKSHRLSLSIFIYEGVLANSLAHSVPSIKLKLKKFLGFWCFFSVLF